MLGIEQEEQRNVRVNLHDTRTHSGFQRPHFHSQEHVDFGHSALNRGVSGPIILPSGNIPMNRVGSLESVDDTEEPPPSYWEVMSRK